MTLPALPVVDPLGRPAIELSRGVAGSGAGQAWAAAPLTLLAPRAPVSAAAGEAVGRRIALDLTPWTTAQLQANVATPAAANTRLVWEVSLDAGATWTALCAVPVDQAGLCVGAVVA